MKNQKLLMALTFIGLVAFSSCKKDKPSDTTDPFIVDEINATLVEMLAHEFNDSICALNTISVVSSVDEPIITDAGTELTGNIECQTFQVEYGPNQTEINLYDISSNVYPGKLFMGNQFSEGNLIPISGFNYGDITISGSSISNPGTENGHLIEELTLSSYLDAFQNIVYSMPPNTTPANFFYKTTNIYSSEMVNSHLGFGASGWGADVSGSFDWGNDLTKSRVLVEFQQKYLTVAVDELNNPSDLFANNEYPSPSELGGTSPLYVSNVSYGRVIYFAFESTSSHEELKAAVDASFSFLGAGGNVSYSHNYEEIMQNSTTKMVVIGGDATIGAGLLAGVSDVNEAIVAAAQFSPENPGVMIAYQLNHLCNNIPAEFVSYTDFTYQECHSIGITETISLDQTDWQEFMPNCLTCGNGGDGEYDGVCAINGSINLVIEDDKIWATVDALFYETDFFESTHGRIYPDLDLSSEVTDPSGYGKILLYTDPEGRQITSININQSVPNFVEYHVSDDDGHGWQSLANQIENCEFIEDMRFIGDTEGGDLPGDGSDGRSKLQIKFKPFSITLSTE